MTSPFAIEGGNSPDLIASQIYPPIGLPNENLLNWTIMNPQMSHQAFNVNSFNPIHMGYPVLGLTGNPLVFMVQMNVFPGNLGTHQNLPPANIPTQRCVDNPTQQQGPSRGRKKTKFSDYQVQKLENRFQIDHYIQQPERSLLARDLNMTGKQVYDWFQNRRMKYKKEHEVDVQNIENGQEFPICKQF